MGSQQCLLQYTSIVIYPSILRKFLFAYEGILEHRVQNKELLFLS